MPSHTRSAPMVANAILPASPSPHQNQILAALPAADYERLQRQLERVPLPLGWAIYEADDAQGYVYFPASSSCPCSTSCRTAPRRRSLS